jgi:hypothetical protein
MAILSEFLVSIVDVVKPEVKRAQRKSVRLIVFSFLSLGFLFAGASLLSWGLYIALISVVGSQGAALIAGGTALIVGLIIILMVKRATD